MSVNVNSSRAFTSELAAAGAIFLISVAAPASAQSPCGPTTTVQSGDTYFAIARRCNVSVGFIEEANPGVSPRNLQVGQTLQLTTNAGRAEPMPNDRYKVQAGDTLSGIAQALGVSLDALLAANPGIDSEALRVGQTILPPRHGVPGRGKPGVGKLGDAGPGVRISGILTDEGVECQAMLGYDGRIYTLIGDLKSHEAGDVVQVRGEVQGASFCQQGTTIKVTTIRSAG